MTKDPWEQGIEILVGIIKFILMIVLFTNIDSHVPEEYDTIIWLAFLILIL
jgi:hypothetical protein